MADQGKLDRRTFLEISALALAPGFLASCDEEPRAPAKDATAVDGKAPDADSGPGDGSDVDGPRVDGPVADGGGASDAGTSSGSPRYGWDPAHDAGTTGDYFVDAAVKSSGDGKTLAAAFATIGEAVAQARVDGAPREIKVLAGTYRESLDLKGFAGRISGHGTDKPVISGAEPLGGWQPCTAADAPLVGPGYTAIHKVTLPRTAFASSTAAGLNLYEDGEPMRLVQDRLGDVDLFFVAYDEDFHRAASFGFDGEGRVTSITDPAVLSKYTAAQLHNAYVYLYHAPNAVSAVPITAVDTATQTIGVGGSQKAQSTTKADVWRYSLANILPALAPGQWGFVDDGGATVTVFCRPSDPASLAGGIEHSARTFCVDLPSTIAGPVTLEGLDLRQPGGDGSAKDGACIGTRSGSITKKPHGLTIRHARVGRCSNPTGGGYGALYLAAVDDCTVEHVTAEYASGCFGTFLQGRTTDAMMRARLTHYHARFTSNAGARFYGQHLCEFSHSLLEDCGYGGHTNQFNFYEQCDRCLVYGVRTRRCVGYATFQEASRLYFGCCEIAVNPDSGDSGRALVDQQNATPPPETDCDNYVWRCLFVPDPKAPQKANAVNLGSKGYPKMRWHLLSSVVHGGGIPPAYLDGLPQIEGSREGNLYTATAWWNTTSKGWAANKSERVQTDLAVVYADASSGDFAPAPKSPMLSHPAADVSAAVAAAKAHFPAFDFSEDIDGASLSGAAPRCGPRADPGGWKA